MDFIFDVLFLVLAIAVVLVLFFETKGNKTTEIEIYIVPTPEERIKYEVCLDMESACEEDGRRHTVFHIIQKHTPRDNNPSRKITTFHCRNCKKRLSPTRADLHMAEQISPVLGLKT